MTAKEARKIKGLTKAYGILTERWPEREEELGMGLLIVLSGGLTLAGDHWEVRTPHLYRVRLEGDPPRWSCSCPQGSSYGPLTGDLYGHPGRACKHVAAVALALQAGDWPGPPANLLAYLERVVDAGAGSLGMKGRGLPNGRSVMLVRDETAATASLALRLGRAESEGLAWRMAEVHGGEEVGHFWTMDPEAGDKYQAWLEDLRQAKEEK